MTASAGLNSIRQAIKRIVAFIPSDDWIVIGWVMAIKTLLFVIGVKSYPMLWDKYCKNKKNTLTPLNRWFALWDQWDFGYYQKIAEFVPKHRVALNSDNEEQGLDCHDPTDHDPVVAWDECNDSLNCLPIFFRPC